MSTLFSRFISKFVSGKASEDRKSSDDDDVDGSEPGSDSSDAANHTSDSGTSASAKATVTDGSKNATTTTTQAEDSGKAPDADGIPDGSDAMTDPASQKDKQWNIYSDPDIVASEQSNRFSQNEVELWDNLVKPYLQKHKPPKPNALVYDVGDLLGDEIIDNFSNATAITAAALNIDNANHAEGDSNHPKITSEEDADDHIKTNNLLANGLLFTSGFFNTALGIKNVLTSGASIYNAKKERNRNKRKQGRYGLAAGFSGIASGVLQSAAAGANIAGSSAGAGLSLAAYTADFATNAINAFGAVSNARHHGKTGALAKRYHSKDKRKNLKLDKNQDKNQRRLIKAQTYAMQQASRFNKEKGEQETTRAMREAFFGAGSSFVGVIAGAIPMLSDYGKGMMGSGIAGLVQMGMKYVGKGVRVKNHLSKEKQNKKRKIEEVDKYLGTKIDKVNDDAKAAHMQELSNNLAKRVALARLGLDVELDENAGIANDVYEKAFDIITIKRARHIYAAQEEKIFRILGLPTDASVLEIAEALGYGD